MITAALLVVFFMWNTGWWYLCNQYVADLMSSFGGAMVSDHTWIARKIIPTFRIRIQRLVDERFTIQYRFAMHPWSTYRYTAKYWHEADAEKAASRLIARVSKWLYVSDHYKVPFKVLRPNRENSGE